MKDPSLLLDTCALLWLGFGSAELSSDVRIRIEETSTVYVSPVSLWEISNKYRQGKLRLKHPPREWFSIAVERFKLTMLPVTNEQMFLAGELPEHHKDPIDRMIIAAAMINRLEVVTSDRNFPKYGIGVIG